jgi:hypothetical protein
MNTNSNGEYFFPLKNVKRFKFDDPQVDNHISKNVKEVLFHSSSSLKFSIIID